MSMIRGVMIPMATRLQRRHGAIMRHRVRLTRAAVAIAVAVAIAIVHLRRRHRRSLDLRSALIKDTLRRLRIATPLRRNMHKHDFKPLILLAIMDNVALVAVGIWCWDGPNGGGGSQDGCESFE